MKKDGKVDTVCQSETLRDCMLKTALWPGSWPKYRKGDPVQS